MHQHRLRGAQHALQGHGQVLILRQRVEMRPEKHRFWTFLADFHAVRGKKQTFGPPLELLQLPQGAGACSQRFLEVSAMPGVGPKMDQLEGP